MLGWLLEGSGYPSDPKNHVFFINELLILMCDKI